MKLARASPRRGPVTRNSTRAPARTRSRSNISNEKRFIVPRRVSPIRARSVLRKAAASCALAHASIRRESAAPAFRRFSLCARPQASGLGCPEREPSAMLPAVSAALPAVPRRAVRPASAPHSLLISARGSGAPARQHLARRLVPPDGGRLHSHMPTHRMKDLLSEPTPSCVASSPRASSPPPPPNR